MEVIKILWIDDDINRQALRPYIDEFSESGIYITKASNPDESFIKLQENNDFDCIIVDISMPYGERIKSEDAKGGMQTGLIVLQNLVADNELSKIPKVVFTIVTNPDVRKYCEDNNIPYLEKQEYYSHSFVQKIRQILKIVQ